MYGFVEEGSERIEGTVSLFKKHCKITLFTIKFDLLDHLLEDLDKFGSVKFLCALAFEHFNIFLKRSYRETYIRSASRLNETSFLLKLIAKGLQRKERDEVSRCESHVKPNYPIFLLGRL